MLDLKNYPAKYFLNAEQLSAACHIPIGELFELIRNQLVPAPSYTVSESATIRSYVFGETPAAGSKEGEYFHPATAQWVTRTHHLIAEVGRDHAPNALKDRFESNLKSALANLNATIWHLSDSFAADGSLIPDGFRIRSQ